MLPKMGDKVLCEDFCGQKEGRWAVGTVEDTEARTFGSIGVRFGSRHGDFYVRREVFAILPETATEEQIRTLASMLGAKSLKYDP